MKKHKGILIAFAIGLVLTIVGIILQIERIDGSIKSILLVMSNSTLFGGAALSVLAFFAVGARNGLFDGIAYGAMRVRQKNKQEKEQYSSYYDYIHREKKGKKYPSFLFPGIVYISIAVILGILCYVI